MKLSSSALMPVISIDRSDKEAIHLQIYKAFSRAIGDGILRPGQRVPSTRALAADLGVSRFPVLTAYAQLLAEGYFEGKVGSGTTIGRLALEPAFDKLPLASKAGRKVQAIDCARRATVPAPALRPHWVRDLGPFGVGQIAFDHFPIKIWTDLVARCGRRMEPSSLACGDYMGLPALRSAVAEYLRTARSVRCEADQIMIVGGAQQGLDICVRVLLEAGTSVWVEDPGYALGRAAFTLNGCRAIPVPVDAEGIQVEEGMVRGGDANAVLVTPSHQFPLGITLSRPRRIQLLEWAKRSGAWVIEDDYDSEFRFDGSPIASLQGMDKTGRVIYIGTLSKVLFPSIRLGYVVVPQELADRFESVRRVMDLGAPRLSQEVLAAFMEQGHFARHIRKMRVVYRERRDTLIQALKEKLPSHLEIIGSEAGLHLTALLCQRCDDVALAMRAAAHQIWLWPLSPHYLEGPQKAGFVLGFGSSPPSEILGAVGKLARLLSE